MNLQILKWSKEEYQKFLTYLLSLANDEYRLFHTKLVKTKYKILGINVPKQRLIAKEILKGNAKSFLKFSQDIYYEEVNIKGFIIANLKDENLIDDFVLKIDNWAICDNFCSSLKIEESNLDKYFKKITQYVNEKDEFIARVGIVLLLNNYLTKDYLPKIFKLINNITLDKYYLNMAIAWLISECYIKEKELTILFLQDNKLSNFIQNKAIAKIKDSYRVSKEEKMMLQCYSK